jgi:hypothetical protein
METKINIAAILKDKPQGTKLYDWLHNIDVELDTISTTDTETVVWCTNETNNNTTCHRGYSEFGTERGYPDGLQILFPSKEMRDWAKFSWKKGDVLVSKDNVYIIFEKFEDDTYTRFKGKHYLWKEFNVEDYNKEETKMLTSVFEKATDDVAQTYIKNIEEHLDGKLNLETLEIEKQLEFKDGDIVVYGKSVAICRKFYKHTLSFYIFLNEMFGLLFADEVESSEEYRFATEEEKQQLFDALEKEGKAWDAEKKQIVDIKKELQFKPFEKVLVRDSYNDMWRASFFSHITEDDGRYVTTCCTWKFCIPYIGNESLVGTTKDVEG